MTYTIDYEAVVVGAGPGGLTFLAALLDSGIRNVAWIDPTFSGGRLNTNYREISSKIIRAIPSPNAIDKLEKIDREKTCQLSLAGDMLHLLSEGFAKLPGVKTLKSDVCSANYTDSRWNIRLSDKTDITSTRMFLCTGSHPIHADFHSAYNPDLSVLDLDQVLLKSQLPTLLPPSSSRYRIAVIGASHSGILVCWNLYQYQQAHDLDLEIYNFQRSPIRYAEYREDGIVYDNTGLKGDTADWAKGNLEPKGNGRTKQIHQVDIKENAEQAYQKYLPDCSHVIYAIGYTPNTYPEISIEGNRVDDRLEFDHSTAGFNVDGKKVEGLWGGGIAHPEVKKDPEGHVEAAVGVAKFFAFAERVKDSWV
ncbi:hypothetical protein P7C73_g2204, partial [Tremellales sp. Uapishka_1]